MFREKLHKDLDGISPDEELLTKVTKMMQEEAQKPKPNTMRVYIRYAGMAAAVCMIAVGTIALKSSDNLKTESAAGTPAAMAMDAAANEAEMNESVSGYSLEAEAESFTADSVTADIKKSNDAEACAEEACDALPEEDGAVTESEIIYEEFSDKKGIVTAEAIYKGNAYELNYDQAGKLIQLVVDYVKENPETVFDYALIPEGVEMYKQSGLYAHIKDSGNREIFIYINDELSFVATDKFYALSDEIKEEILGYFE